MKLNNENKYDKLYWLINLIMIFLFGMQFMGFPHQVSFIWLGIIFVLNAIACKNIIIDIPAVLLGIGMLVYAYIAGKGFKDVVIFAGLPVLTYLAGKGLSMRKYSFCSVEDNSKATVMALTLGTFACGLLEKYSRFFRFTEECYSGRYWFDFWDGGIRPATYFMFYSMMILGCVCWAVYIRKDKKIFSNIFLVIAVMELIFFGWVKTRTPFLVIAGVVAVGAVMFLWMNRREKFIKKTLVYGGIFIGAAVIIAAGVWYGNLFNIQNSVIGKVLTHDGGIFQNIRFVGQRNVLMQLFEYPMGGKLMDIAGLKYAHNVWLDIAYTSGAIPFFFVAAFTICTFWCCVKLVKNDKIPAEMKYLMIGVFLALHLDYSVEPVLDANLTFWAMGTFVSGIMKGYLYSRGE